MWNQKHETLWSSSTCWHCKISRKAFKITKTSIYTVATFSHWFEPRRVLLEKVISQTSLKARNLPYEWNITYYLSYGVMIMVGFHFSFLLLSSVLHMSGSMTLKSVCIISWPGVTFTKHTKQILHKNSLNTTLNDNLNVLRVARKKGYCLKVDNITRLRGMFIMPSLHSKLNF